MISIDFSHSHCENLF